MSIEFNARTVPDTLHFSVSIHFPIVANPENEIYLSAISVWEAILLLEKKRVQLNEDFREWFKKSKLELGLIELPLSWEIAHEIRYTILGYRDPGDRFLVATAKVYDLTLVTADERLMQTPGLKVLANR